MSLLSCFNITIGRDILLGRLVHSLKQEGYKKAAQETAYSLASRYKHDPVTAKCLVRAVDFICRHEGIMSASLLCLHIARRSVGGVVEEAALDKFRELRQLPEDKFISSLNAAANDDHMDLIKTAKAVRPEDFFKSLTI